MLIVHRHVVPLKWIHSSPNIHEIQILLWLSDFTVPPPPNKEVSRGGGDPNWIQWEPISDPILARIPSLEVSIDGVPIIPC